MSRSPREAQGDGRQARWEPHNAERRQHILDAAVTVLERSPVGSEVRVRQIADEAGLVRTVLYRHFRGREDLDRSLQARIVELMRSAVLPAITFEGSIESMIRRVVSAYIAWVDAHPNLYFTVTRELGGDQPSELTVAIQDTVGQLSELFRAGADLFGIELDETQLATVDLLVVGLVGQLRGTVDHWVRRSPRSPHAGVLTHMLCLWIWFQIDGQARQVGLHLDPTVPVEQVMGPAT